MAEGFLFNANQYFDFNQLKDEEKLEAYFESDHENEPLANNQRRISVSDDREDSNSEDLQFFTPRPQTDVSATVYLETKMRRSMSMNDIQFQNQPENEPESLRAEMNVLTISTEQVEVEVMQNNKSDIKTKNRTNLVRMKPRTISRENLLKLAQPKQRKFASNENLSSNQYVSMAEAVKNFHKQTPRRFHSKPPKSEPVVRKNHLELTRPATPNFQTKVRARPPGVPIPTREEREWQEIKNFKIRAHPVNKKVLNVPFKAQILGKPATVPEPFHLSQGLKKTVQSKPSENHVFHAQPIPKSLYKSPFKPKPSEAQVVTVAQTPNFVRKYTESRPKVEAKKPPLSPQRPFKPVATQVVPFSFEERDEIIIRKREELVRQALEREKKAREFHANPVPRKLLCSRQRSVDSIDSGSSRKHSNSDDNSIVSTFKARPAAVLKKKPFEPIKVELAPIQFEEFHFQTDERQSKRFEFDFQLREKEEQVRMYQERERLRQLAYEEEERKRLRKLAEVKAQPIKKYKEVHIQPSNKLTEPISPKFHTGERLKNKENVPNND